MQSQNIALFILFSLAPAVAQGAKDQQCDTKECAADTGSLLMTNKIVTELSTDTELANKDNEGKMLVQASGCSGCEKLMGIKEQLVNDLAKVEAALKDCLEAPAPTPASPCPHGDGKAFPGKHVGYKLICFQGEPFEFVEGAPTPTFEDGYVTIPGGSCGGENQLNNEADLAPKHQWGGIACSGQDDCYTRAKNWCDSNPSCVSFELYPGWPHSDTEAPYQVSFSSSCQRNGCPPNQRLSLSGAKGCNHDLYIKLPLAQPTAMWLQPGTDSYKMPTNYVMGTLGANECPGDSVPILNKLGCEQAMDAFGFRAGANNQWMKNNMAKDSETYPKGCYRHASGENVYYNADASGGAPNDDATPICRIVS